MLEISISPGVHGTPGLGRSIIKSINSHIENPYLEEDGVIKNFKDLKKAAQKGGQGNKLKNIIESFETLKQKLIEVDGFSQDIDPIEYLIYLYFKEELSLKDILTRINGKGFYYKDESGLRKLLKQSLKWKLRDKTEKTTHGRKRISKNTGNIEQEKADASKLSFLSWFIQSGQSISKQTFDTNICLGLRNKTEKIIYIFDKVFGISRLGLEELYTFSLSHRILAELIEEKIRETGMIGESTLSKIGKSDIDRLFSHIQKNS